MEKINSYLGMADNDFAFASGGMRTCSELGVYNSIASLCAQACEKYLKAIIELCFADHQELKSLLRTHNLRTLYNVISKKYDLGVTTKDCKWVGDFYFDARYPGDDFVEVTFDDATECLAITEKLKGVAHAIVGEERKKREESQTQLKKLAAFLSGE